MGDRLLEMTTIGGGTVLIGAAILRRLPLYRGRSTGLSKLTRVQATACGRTRARMCIIRGLGRAALPSSQPQARMMEAEV